ncbi:D-alanyl-D-alanine carboxypeptidase [Paracoccus marinaquae]|uniref:D-alanyl-D-alanine carboxypeptidase n=1 Tax=Paracoccus marinaquae TaxID=2841926 RepID=A0ABS6AIV3_9RHOB|nr:D-alanyl-D-alanine carboxypeptidase [Paracoccus marinaquae]MBU3029316.1 D-alanyl-D-alanine carboxypeptidase [Paracoccus marinaquae]
MTKLGRRAFLSAAMAAIPAAQGWALTGGGLAQRPPARPLPDAARSIAAADLPGTVGYALVDPQSGALLDGGAGAASLPPASTMKVLTALYALDRLGQGYRFRTRVLVAGDMLVLAGGGDPVLSSDGLAALAADLVASGQPAPARFAVWGGALPRLAEIAPEQADHLAYNPTLSGMILNFNRVHLGWRRANGGVQMSLEARAAANSPRAYTISAQAGDQRELFTYRAEPLREYWTVARSAVARPGSRWLPVRKPELYAGDVFQTLCRAKGLVLPTPEVIEELPAGTEIASLESPPLSELLRDMLYYSTNLTAEVIGLQASGAAGIAASAAAMQGWLRDQGLAEGFRLADHSGLAGDSRVTAEGLARALTLAQGAATLTPLLKRDPLDEDLGAMPARGFDVMAKTGTLNFVSNLAGHLNVPGGGTAGFAILCADSPRHAATSGQELPAGVIGWTKAAKRLQRDILTGWVARYL